MTWPRVRLEQLCDVVTKGTTPTTLGFGYSQTGIPFLRAENLQDGTIKLGDGTLFIDEDTDQALSRSRIYPRDVLISIAGTIGRASVVPDDAGLMNCNQAVAIVRISRKLDQRYFLRWLGTADARRQIAGAQVTATISNLSLTSIRSLEVPLPPLDEQRRIAAILDKADAIRRKRQVAISLCAKIPRATFVELFGDPKDNPASWPVVPLEHLANIGSGVTKGRKFNGQQTVWAPYLRVANVQDGFLDLSEIKVIEVLPSDLDKYRLKDGDVVMTEGGDPDKLGRGAVWRGQVAGCIHQNHIFRVRVWQERILPEYLSFLTSSDYGKRYFLRSAKQTTGIASINMTQLKAFPVVLPPMDLQVKFADHVHACQEAEAQLLLAWQESERLCQGLASDLLTFESRSTIVYASSK